MNLEFYSLDTLLRQAQLEARDHDRHGLYLLLGVIRNRLTDENNA